MYRRILVPLDGTRFGDHALPYAISIAARTGATLELVHVHHRAELDAGLDGMPQYRFQHIEEAEDRFDDSTMLSEQRYLEERAADIELRFGVRAYGRMLQGRTDTAVCDEVDTIVADLVVMATHARSGLPRLRHGDLAHELVRNLNVPTLCVRPTSEDSPLEGGALRRILVPLDGSDFSEQILDIVVPLASAIGARIDLLHVLAPRPLMITGFNDLQRLIPHRAEAIEYLRSVAERLPARVQAPELIVVESGDPASAIVAAMAGAQHDSIAIATHGRSGLSRLILGSVAEQVVRATAKPVLLYRPRLARLPAGDLADAFRIYGE
jgi:nucleotide-binding universal stress UspA family protein